MRRASAVGPAASGRQRRRSWGATRRAEATPWAHLEQPHAPRELQAGGGALGGQPGQRPAQPGRGLPRRRQHGDAWSKRRAMVMAEGRGGLPNVPPLARRPPRPPRPPQPWRAHTPACTPPDVTICPSPALSSAPGLFLSPCQGKPSAHSPQAPRHPPRPAQRHPDYAGTRGPPAPRLRKPGSAWRLALERCRPPPPRLRLPCRPRLAAAQRTWRPSLPLCPKRSCTCTWRVR